MIEAPGTAGARCYERVLKSEKNHDQQACAAMRAKGSVLSCGLHDAHLFQASLSVAPREKSRKETKDKVIFKVVALREKSNTDEFHKQIEQDGKKAKAHGPIYEQIYKAEKIGVELSRYRIAQRKAQDKYTEY